MREKIAYLSFDPFLRPAGSLAARGAAADDFGTRSIGWPRPAPVERWTYLMIRAAVFSGYNWDAAEKLLQSRRH